MWRLFAPQYKTILQLKLKSLQAQLEYPANSLMEVASIAMIGLLGIPSLLLLTTAFPSIGGWDFYMLRLPPVWDLGLKTLTKSPVTFKGAVLRA